MRKRTNIFKEYFFEFLRLFLPFFVILILIFMLGHKNLGTMKSFTASNNNSGAANDKYGETVKITSSAVKDIPDDIDELMKNSQGIYDPANKLGDIFEKELSRQGATNEYNGVYLRNTTQNKSIQIGDLLNKKINFNFEKGSPDILIYHTHICDTYEILSKGFYTDKRGNRSENENENMIRIGTELVKELQKQGFNVIYDKTKYDDQYGGAYERARNGVSKILKDNPSIQVVIDLQRGSVVQKDGSKIKPTIEKNGEKFAQMTVICGCEDMNVSDFPNWEKNLSLGLKLQQQLTKDLEGVAKPLYLCSRKYNMDLMNNAIQIEIGTDANTLLEAVNSARVLAKSLSMLLREEVK